MTTFELNTELKLDAKQLRNEIFVKEQGIDPKEEFTGDDDNYNHFSLYVDDVLVSYLRLHFGTSYVLIGRVVTRKEYRNKGYASTLIKQVEEIAKSYDYKGIKLHSQEQVIPFYEKLGYKASKRRYYEAGIPHHNMRKEF